MNGDRLEMARRCCKYCKKENFTHTRKQAKKMATIGALEQAGLLAIGAVFGCAGLLISQDVFSKDSTITTLGDWQTLITGLLAVGAATIALRPAYAQVQTSTKQYLVMAREAALKLRDGLNGEMEACKSAQKIALQIRMRMESGIYPDTNVSGEIRSTAVEIRIQYQYFYAAGQIDPRDKKLSEARYEAVEAMRSLVESMEKLEFATRPPASIAGWAGENLTRIQSTKRDITAIEYVFQKAMTHYIENLQIEIDNKMKLVKSFEDRIFT